MGRALAVEIATIEGALRSTLEDITDIAATGHDRVDDLVSRARLLADKLTIAVDRLDDANDEAEAARRKAAYLAARLAVLERSLGGASWH